MVTPVRALLMCLAWSCSATQPRAHLTPEPTSAAPLEVSVSGPSRARYDAASVGIGGQQITIALENHASEPVSIDGFTIELAARRGGVQFPCAEHVPLARREPRVIAKGERVEIVREIDCTMPLLGTYDLQVFASWRGAARREIGALSVEVYDTAKRAPRALRPGVLATVAGPTLVMPTTSYQAMVVLVNESGGEQRVAPFEITLRSKPDRESLWCQGAPSTLAPPPIAAGHVWVARAKLACKLDSVGGYTVEALAGSSEIGSMRVEVTDDPNRIVPPL